MRAIGSRSDLPEATHWFDQSGEVTCSTFYERSIWWSLTRILKDSDPIPQVEDLLRRNHIEA
jgi:hypothetical protein